MDSQEINIKQLENLTLWEKFVLDSKLPESEFKTYAIFYASNKCFLGLVNENGEIDVQNDKNFDINKVFEARIFNKNAELRWLKGFDEKIIKDSDFSNDQELLKPIKQKYLIWGEKIKDEANPKGWTQFGTARIGTFYVPIEIDSNKNYAQFEAIEYLMSENENGNVFVIDERLTGISEV